jgi:transposase-like protein
MFINTERSLIVHPSKASKADRELAWRERPVRYASSHQSVEAFCRSESVSSASFYAWRSRLRAQDLSGLAGGKAAPDPSPFIDLGSISPAVAASACAQERSNAVDGAARSGIEVRIDLGDGVPLTIVRR